ncbi:MAG: hypothetical protein V3R77_05690 [Candidatus Binatia bacterium]
MRTNNRLALLPALSLALVMGAGLAAGCGAKREPVYASPKLAQSDVRTLQLMPVIDTRPDPFDAVTAANQFRSASKRVLEGRGYLVSIEAISSSERQVSAGGIAKMDIRQLSDLAPPDQRYLMFLYIDQIERGYDTRGERSRVRVRARLIDAQVQAEMWRDEASAESALMGMLSILSGPGSDYEALFQAARNLFLTLPDRKKG